MRTTPVISLDVRQGSSSDAGWQDVEASNGQTYSFHYSGGDDAKGGVRAIVGKGVVTGPLRLVADKRYELDGCLFTDDTHDQLSWSGKGQAGSLRDENTKAQTAYYTTIVLDTVAKCQIPCDPMIKNELR
ncbi:MAG: hypothetical protein V4704_08575 [Pseudomonadota bacterium]